MLGVEGRFPGVQKLEESAPNLRERKTETDQRVSKAFGKSRARDRLRVTFSHSLSAPESCLIAQRSRLSQITFFDEVYRKWPMLRISNLLFVTMGLEWSRYRAGFW
ncbi:hypothetical protein OPV22_023891 [Ensete ventricosum]|uniref:Uncharacterized protein n=1 Tax=Ensete ventricosum TaxID=4639 RepID=A0AAV8QT88_ENSVE|nr:hypothetical protein OPV22_023891 [Ensete ventricosum]